MFSLSEKITGFPAIGKWVAPPKRSLDGFCEHPIVRNGYSQVSAPEVPTWQKYLVATRRFALKKKGWLQERPILIVFICWFPKMGVPKYGWFIGKNPIKMDDLGVPLFLETTILAYSIYMVVVNQIKYDKRCNG